MKNRKMPLIRLEELTHDTFLGLWKIDETTEELKSMQDLSIPEELFFSGLRNQQRKKHWLSYRLILKAIPGVIGPIAYDEFGKPLLPGSGHRISVTHSGIFSALLVSRNAETGIDIEKISDRIERVKERFLSQKELEETGQKDRLEKLYVAWGIKESIYKIFGKPGIEFNRDIVVLPFEYQKNGSCEAVLTLEQQERFDIRYEEIENYMLVYTWRKEKND